MPGAFTPTPEQLALREARRLQKEKTATNASATAPKSHVNNEKGQIVPRPWLAVQDSLTNATHSAKIMTWNVRNFVFVPVHTALLDRHRSPYTYTPASSS